MAIRRPDGLYDVPEAGLWGVPAAAVPTQMRLPATPDMQVAHSIELARARGLKPPAPSSVRNDVPPPTPQETTVGNVVSDAVAPVTNAVTGFSDPYGFNAQAPQDQPQQAPPQAAPADLHGPDSTGAAPGSSPQDQFFRELIRRGALGSPGVTIPEHQAKTAEAWTSQGDVPRPGSSEVPLIPGESAPTSHVVPGDSEQVFKPDAEGGHIGPKSEDTLVEDQPEGPGYWKTIKQGKEFIKKWVPTDAEPTSAVIPNTDLQKAAKSLQSETENETLAHQEESLQRQGGQARAIGDLQLEGAQREKEINDLLMQDYLKQRQRVEDAQAQFDDFTKQYLAQAMKEPPPAPLGRRLMVGLAQGMIYAGAAGAGQQVPHLDWIGDEVKKQVVQQQNVLNAYGHVAGLKLNSLQALQQRMDPISATHALTAGIYTQLAHEADAMAQKYRQGSAYDSAVAMRDAFNKRAVDAQAAASQAHWQQQIQTIPKQTVGARAGGLPGMLAALEQSMKGAPKETIDAAKNALIEQIKNGEAPTFPGAPKPKADRAQVEAQKDVRSRTWTAPDFMGGAKLFTARDDDAKKYQGIAGDTEELVSHVRRIKDLVAQVGSTLSPNVRQAVKTEQAWLMNASRRLANTGVPQEMELEKIIKPMAAMDANELIKLPNRGQMLDNVVEAAKRSVISQTAKGSYRDPELNTPFQTNTQRAME